jgi:hypothetical protein
MSAREAHEKKEDELVIPNTLEIDTHFKVACSVAALPLFSMIRTAKGKQPEATHSKNARNLTRRHCQTCGSIYCSNNPWKS